MANNQTHVRSARHPDGLLYFVSDWNSTFRLSNIRIGVPPQHPGTFGDAWEEVSTSGSYAAQDVQHLAVDPPEVIEMLVRVAGYANLWTRKCTSAESFPQPLGRGQRQVIRLGVSLSHQLSSCTLSIPGTPYATMQNTGSNSNEAANTLAGTTTPPHQDDNGPDSE